MKTFTPTIYKNDTLIGFDLEVYSLQVALARIDWLQAIFAVAHIQKRTKSEEESISTRSEGRTGTKRFDAYYPQGNFNGKSFDLSFDDSYASRAFFLIKKDTDITPKTDTWNWVEDNVEIAQPFSVILHCNLQKLELSSQEQIKTDFLYALSNCPKVTGLSMDEDMTEVWKEFTITPEINGITRYPNYCVRFDGILTYLAFPYNGEIKYNPSQDVQVRSVIGWKVCQVRCEVVSIVNPLNMQMLDNGDIIPVEYVANLDGTVTMPYLNSIFGITLLSRFMLNGDYYQGDFFIAGNINTSPNGALGDGDKLNFDASLPLFNYEQIS